MKTIIKTLFEAITSFSIKLSVKAGDLLDIGTDKATNNKTKDKQ
jgi:hypothetical protein